ncbi:ATP-binding protein [Brucella sp. RRSP16]|uniref:ATP-binding protein n=1 Tax=Brucella sp. RRSP16 TaxID=3453707 RepID=UPI003FCC7EC2
MDKEEWLGLMLDREIAVQADKRLTARLVAAKLRFPEASVEDIDFHAARNLDRRATTALAQGQWLKNHENLIVTGKTGTGKSWLACAFWGVRLPDMTISFSMSARPVSSKISPWLGWTAAIQGS